MPHEFTPSNTPFWKASMRSKAKLDPDSSTCLEADRLINDARASR